MGGGPSIALIGFRPRPPNPIDSQREAPVIRKLERAHPKVAELLADAEGDLSAFTGFPGAHWRQIKSLALLNREMKRRTDGGLPVCFARTLRPCRGELLAVPNHRRCSYTARRAAPKLGRPLRTLSLS